MGQCARLTKVLLWLACLFCLQAVRGPRGLAKQLVVAQGRTQCPLMLPKIRIQWAATAFGLDVFVHAVRPAFRGTEAGLGVFQFFVNIAAVVMKVAFSCLNRR